MGIYVCVDYLSDAISENDYERARDAIRDGADLNPKDAELPPLHQAVALGYIRIVKLLLDNGANPNLRTEDGRVPLDFATDDEIRELLKEYGAKEF
jgi:ankyrin repeat protein